MVFFQSPALRALGVPHGFSTRVGPGGNTAFTLASGNDLHQAQFAVALDCADRACVNVYQVHGACVWEGASSGVAECRVEADAIVSADPSQLLLIRTADCVPVLMASADGHRVGAVHAGWKGLVGGVIPNAAAALAAPGFIAAIGPCMGLEAFEVDEDVAQKFEAADLAEAVVRRGFVKPHVDLRLAATLQLRRAGASVVDSSDLCTYRDEGLFFSFRRDKTHRGLEKSGHMASAIGSLR